MQISGRVYSCRQITGSYLLDIKYQISKQMSSSYLLEKEKFMGANKQKLYSFRTDDELIEKLNILAERHSRTRNKEIEYALKQYVAACEQEEGRTNTGKLSVSKIG